MKFKYLAILLVVISCFANSYAQERKFEIEVSMEETNISRNAETIPVKVKITNKAKEVLKTQGLGSIEFGFSKCLQRQDCFGNLETFNSKVRVPEKTLRENESVEFVFDLKELHWFDKTSSYFDTNSPKNFAKTVTDKQIYFQAIIDIPKGYKTDKKLKRKIPINKSFHSNTITVVINK